MASIYPHSIYIVCNKKDAILINQTKGIVLLMASNKNKPSHMNKGLSDRELIAKYEKGKTPVKSVVARMLRMKSPTSTKNLKKK